MNPQSPRIVLKEGRDSPFRLGHPWVFSGAVKRLEGSPRVGDAVAVLTHQGDFIGWGLYNPNSQIVVRLYSWSEQERISDALLQERIRNAIALRRSVPGLFTGEGAEAVRLIFSESDGLSGLTVDYYAGYVGLQITSLALSLRLEAIADCLEEVLKPKGLYLRTEKGIRELEGLEISDRWLRGQPPQGAVEIQDQGLIYSVNLTEGHKTGFYLDQRDNRKRASDFAAGRNCLDVCCYTGGFSLNLMRGGARSVLGIDASASAIETASANASRNGISGAQFVKGDAFSRMEVLKEKGERFDLIVLDPPRFAQKTKGHSQALKGYAGLNGLAVRLLNPGSILVTCSCSGRVTRGEFAFMLAEVARSTQRRIRILETRGAAPDHPVSASCPESDYLKCFFCHVE